jgi:hypothetical protein
MKLTPSIVRIKKIEPPKTQIELSETQLDEAAQLILELQGVVTPLILLRTAPESESYRVIDGYFEYLAAKKAMEIDSRKGSMINAYIIESDNEIAVYNKQIEVFRQRKIIPIASENSQEARITALETEMRELKNELKSRDNLLLDAIKQIGDKIAAQIKPPQTPPPTIIASSQEEQNLLEEINTLPILELNSKLEQITIKTVRENIIKERQNTSFQPFQSSHELIKRITGLGKKTFDKMFDKYKVLNF